MPVSREHKIIGVMCAIFYLQVMFIGFEVVKAHIANKVAAVQEHDGKVASATLADAIKSRDEAQEKYAKTVQATPIKTAAQAVQIINHYVPVPSLAGTDNGNGTDGGTPAGSAAAPGSIEIPKVDVTQVDRDKLPESSSYTLQTSDFAIATAKQLQQCDVNSHALTACRADLADVNSEKAISDQNAQTWEKAAKGGSKWTRVWTATKWTLTGVAVGTALGYAAHH